MKKETGARRKSAGVKPARKKPARRKPARRKLTRKKPVKKTPGKKGRPDPMSGLMREFLAAGADAEALSNILRVIGVDRYDIKRRPKVRK
jgi:hypothetical protein